jgi:hypothetical protein
MPRILIQILFFLLPLASIGQSNPAPFDLSAGNYSMIQWSSAATAGTYPANMRFHMCSTVNAGLSAAVSSDYSGIYNSSSGARLNGLASSGFYMAGVYNVSPTVGAAVLGLNSVGRGTIQLSYQVSTFLTGNPANVRLQYRTASNNATWTDVPGPVEYVSNGTTSLTPTTYTINLSILLSGALDNRPDFQLRWKYYRTSGTAVNDCAIAIDEITITTQPLPSPAISTGLIPDLTYCITPTATTSLLLPFRYTPSSSFSGSNFTAQLSNASGAFSSPVAVGTVATDNTGSQSINVTLPANTPTGSGYKLRLINSDLSIDGNDNGAPFTINLVPVTVTGITPNARYKSVLLNWTNSTVCWDEVMVTVRQGALPSGTPSGNGTQYVANNNYGQGTAVGDAYAVYKGTGASVEVLSLVPEVSYGFNVWTRYGNDWINATPFSVITPEIPSVNAAPTKISQAEFFWNSDPGVGSGTPFVAADGNYSAAFEQLLKNGLQAPRRGQSLFTARVKDGAGNWSVVFNTIVNVDSFDLHPGYSLQKIIAAEYWWNNDPGQGSGVQLLALDGNLNAAFEYLFNNGLSAPSFGRNVFNVRIKDGNNSWSPVFSTIVNVDSSDTHLGYALQNLTQAEYWWNNDSASTAPLLALDGNLNAAFEYLFKNGLSAPSFGRHVFKVRVKDGFNNWSPVFSTVVNVDSLDTHPGYALQKLIQAEYWWNNDSNAISTLLALDGNINAAFENLFKDNLVAPRFGKSVFSVRVKDGFNNWSPVFSTLVNVDSLDTHPGYSLQKLIQAEYWWNNDTMPVNPQPLLALDGNINAALEQLFVNGLFAPKFGRSIFSIRVKDGFNNWSPIFNTIINVDSLDTHPGYPLQKIIQAEYWWNDDSLVKPTLLALDGNINAAFEYLFKNGLTAPKAGQSKLNVRILDGNNNWSPVFSTIVNVDSFDIHPGYPLPRLLQAEYWWNADPGVDNGTPLIALDGNFSAAFEILFSNGLVAPRNGRNTFNVRIRANDNIWSEKFTTVVNVDSNDVFTGYALQKIIQAEYWWNADPGAGNGITMLALDGNINAAFENVIKNGVNAPRNGISTFNIRVKDQNNNWSDKFATVVNIDSNAILPTVFLPYRIKQMECFWDTDPGEGNGTYMTATDNYPNSSFERFNMPSGYVQNIPNGVHMLGMRSRDANGVWSPVFKTTVDVDMGGNTFAVYTNPSYTVKCQGQSVTLNALGAVSYRWSPSTGLNIDTGTSVIATPTVTTTYTVTGTNPFGLTTTASVTIEVTSPAAIAGASEITICPGETAQLTSTSSIGNYWTTGETSKNITVSQPGVYTLISENGCGINSSSVKVIVRSVVTPVISADGPTQFCIGSGVNLTASYGESFLWSNGFTDQSIYAGTTGNYTVTVRDVNGCAVSSLPVAVTASEVPNASITAGAATTICSGNYVTLKAAKGTGYQYEWLKDGMSVPNASSDTFNVISSGFYGVIVTYLGCSGLSNFINATVIPLPPTEVTVQGSNIICSGSSVKLQAATGTGYTYQWKLNNTDISGATSSSYVASTQGSYTVRITDNICSTVTSAVNITVVSAPAASITTLGSLSLCAGNTVTFTASAGTGYSYQWYKDNVAITTGGTSQSYTTGQAGQYYVVVTSSGCSTTSSTKTVVVNPIPTSTITPAGSVNLCTGGSVVLNASTGTGYTYQWKYNNINLSGATSAAHTATLAGNYTLTVSANGCTSTSSPVTVTIGSSVTATIAAQGSTSICGGNTVTLSVNTGTGWTYQWKKDGSNIPNANAATYAAAAAGSYVCVVSNNGCLSTSNTINVQETSCNTTVNLKLYLQGFYLPGNTLNAALLNSGVPSSLASQSDTIVVEIRNGQTGALVAGPTKSILNTSGTATVNLGSLSGSHYIVIKHRNSLETWSAQPVALSGNVSYDFTTSATKAYGDNQANMGDGKFAFWSGDVNQDGVIESMDYTIMENDVLSILFGYHSTDINGDGIVESSDYYLMENNIIQLIFAQKPF